MLEAFRSDLRQALRTARRQPGLVVTAMLTLACGVAATALVMSAGDAILLRPLAIDQPEQVFVIRRDGEPRARFPPAFQQALRSSGEPFSDVAARFTFPVTVVRGSSGTRASASFVSDNFFDVLGVRARMGRVFHQEAELVVISDTFWKEAFQRRTDVVGSAIRVGAAIFTVAGVLSRDFQGLQRDIAVDIWIPMSTVSSAIPIPRFRPSVDVVVRLPREIRPAAADSRLTAEFERWSAGNSRGGAGSDRRQLLLVPASHGLDVIVREQFASALPLLVAIVACLWLIAIVNVSGLLEARLRQRSREIGVRLALGITSRRLFGNLLAESALLIAGGMCLGLATAALLGPQLPLWMPRWASVDVRMSSLTFVASGVAGMLAALLIATIQAVAVDRGQVRHLLAPGPVTIAGRPRISTSTWLVTAQIALTLPLMIAAALLGETLYKLHNTETGFARTNLLQVEVEPLLAGYSAERSRAYYADALAAVRTSPGIVDAALSSGGALSGFEGRSRVRQGLNTLDVVLNAVDERYFLTLGIELRAGRSFEPAEVRHGREVVVINAALAQQLFGSEAAAIGRNVTLMSGSTATDRTVVGVVDNTADVNLRDRGGAAAYVPVGDAPLLLIHARAADSAIPAISTVREALTSLDPNVPILDIQRIEARRQVALQRERLLTALAGTGAWLALVISAVGIFGRASHEVSVRMREIGIRSALGAAPRHIATLFLQRTGGMLVAGLAAGSVIAVLSARTVESFLYGVSPNRPGTYVAAAVLLAAVAVLATLLPLAGALRATAAANLRQE